MQTLPLYRTLVPSARDLERLFAGPAAGQLSPAVDIVETPTDYRLSAAVPGIRREDLQVQIDKNVLEIRGEFRRQVDADARETRRERRYGTFTRRFLLPEDADLEAIDASYADGILSIAVAKRPTATARIIEVTAAAPAAAQLTE